MKKHYRKYCMHLAYAIISTSCFVLTSSKALAQEKLSITPELSKQVIEKYNLENFKIYPVISKEVNYYPYIQGQVLTDDYKRELKRLEQYKPAFDLYNTALKTNEEKKEAIIAIINNINVFLDSNEKYDVKEKLLIESQSLADKFDIKVSVTDDRIKLGDFVKTPNSNQPTSTRKILIYEKDKRPSKNDLKTFQSEIQKMKIKEPEKTNDYRSYLESQKELTTIQKTETGRVLSDKLSKKSVYVIAENSVDLTALSGGFTELPESYSLINEDIAYKFVKNELISRSNEYRNQRDEFNGFSIIKKSSTNEIYYVMSNKFIGQLKIELDDIKYKNLGNTEEYKVWKTKYLALLQSAQTNVNTCNAIIKKHTYLNRLGQKKYDSETFTKQEKISFNQNLDSLKEKLNKIEDLEDEPDFLAFYNNKASTVEATRSYSLSSFYSNTSKSY
jgi:hypothetical protein